MGDASHYEGSSGFLRWWPMLLTLAALLLGLASFGQPGTIQWATLFAALAVLHALWVPWRFVVADDGLLLTFPFGRRRFLPKSSTSIRLDYVGAFAMVGSRRRFGYPLHERFLYEPGQAPRLRNAFAWFGYDVLA
jgi:hypothetical protein